MSRCHPIGMCMDEFYLNGLQFEVAVCEAMTLWFLVLP